MRGLSESALCSAPLGTNCGAWSGTLVPALRWRYGIHVLCCSEWPQGHSSGRRRCIASKASMLSLCSSERFRVCSGALVLLTKAASEDGGSAARRKSKEGFEGHLSLVPCPFPEPSLVPLEATVQQDVLQARSTHLLLRHAAHGRPCIVPMHGVLPRSTPLQWAWAGLGSALCARRRKAAALCRLVPLIDRSEGDQRSCAFTQLLHACEVPRALERSELSSTAAGSRSVNVTC